MSVKRSSSSSPARNGEALAQGHPSAEKSNPGELKLGELNFAEDEIAEPKRESRSRHRHRSLTAGQGANLAIPIDPAAEEKRESASLDREAKPRPPLSQEPMPQAAKASLSQTPLATKPPEIEEEGAEKAAPSKSAATLYYKSVSPQGPPGSAAKTTGPHLRSTELPSRPRDIPAERSASPSKLPMNSNPASFRSGSPSSGEATPVSGVRPQGVSPRAANPTGTGDSTKSAEFGHSAQQAKSFEPTKPVETAQAAPVSASGSRPSEIESRRPSRSGAIPDYRDNIRRQSQEQKSLLSLLQIIGITLGAVFVLGAALAIYGAYVLSQRLHDQSVTLADLRSHFEGETERLTAGIKAADDTLSQTKNELDESNSTLSHQQALLQQLQLELTRGQTQWAQTQAALNRERVARQAAQAALSSRIDQLPLQR